MSILVVAITKKKNKQTKKIPCECSEVIGGTGRCIHKLNLLTTPENTITYHHTLCWSLQFCRSIVFSFSWGHFNSQEKLKTMLMQNFGVTNKAYYGMLWYFLEWSITPHKTDIRFSDSRLELLMKTQMRPGTIRFETRLRFSIETPSPFPHCYFLRLWNGHPYRISSVITSMGSIETVVLRFQKCLHVKGPGCRIDNRMLGTK